MRVFSGSAALAAATLVLTSCAIGPNYKRPAVAVPPAFRDEPATAGAGGQNASIADSKWTELFHDDTLNQLVTSALQRNFDLRQAAERVEQARAQFGITRANQFPFLDAQAFFNANRQSTIGTVRFIPSGTSLSVAYSQIGAALSWELDVWGRLRRLTESARAQYLATEEARRGVVVSLVSEVSTDYFQLLELDLELDISQRTRQAAEESLRITQLRRERGAASGLDVRQAEQLLYTATAQIEAVQRNIAQTENAISLLLADAPAGQPRGRALNEVPVPPSVPAGLPSALLERRPDIRQAEQNLVAANAQVGAARALYFPQIALTAFAGGQSRALSQIASGSAALLSATPEVVQPIFRAGQIRNQVRLTEAQKRELVVNYERTIYTALREVADALVGFERLRTQREQQENLVRALTDAVRLSTLRYRGGLDSYLQVLDARRTLFSGELVLAQLRLQERLSVVQLYRALGGGWQ